ncbi:MAG: glycosyltransferase family 2 protein [Bacteroidota bacterium]
MNPERVISSLHQPNLTPVSDEPTDTRKSVTIITPAYNEEAIITPNLQRLCDYMEGLESQYRWDILVVNDGSKDNTAQLADAFAASRAEVNVIHHRINRNLGGALRTGFRNAKGDYVIVLDLDLSYDEEHIERLLIEIEETDAAVVIASPYMKGGRNTKVPFFRLLLSKTVNHFLRITSPKKIHTFTSMVRVYKREFLQTLNLKSTTYAINPEIIHKAIILRARVEEIPAHLDWSFQEQVKGSRASSIRIFKGILSGLMSGFIFRPYMFFMSVGVVSMIVSLWVISWIFYHTFDVYSTVEVTSTIFDARFTEAVAEVFRTRPHAFFVGGFTFLTALQFLGIGFLSLQNKRYFDELFHINSSQLLEMHNAHSKDKA